MAQLRKPAWRWVAWALWIVPTILFFPFLLPLLDPPTIPRAIRRYGDMYVVLFAIPYSLGALAWLAARRESARRN